MWLLRNAVKSLSIRCDRTMFYYAVAKGRKVGIYKTWKECSDQVLGFAGASYKKFNNESEAKQFIEHRGSGSGAAFDPVATVVPLGKKTQQPPAEWKTPATRPSGTDSNKDNADFWPEAESESFGEDDGLTEHELLAALSEVEGIPRESTQNNKRKATSSYDSKQASTSRSAKAPKLESIVLVPAAAKRVGAFEFLIDSEGFVIAYTDGSCLRNGRPDACAGFGVYFGEGHALNVGKPVTGRVTNNVGEIQAAIYAIKVAIDLGISKLCISTDSQFLINSITMWVSAWKRRNWRLKTGEPVKNVVDFKELDELLNTPNLTVKWNYVKGHEGIKGNEMADKLAREGSAIYEKLHRKKS